MPRGRGAEGDSRNPGEEDGDGPEADANRRGARSFEEVAQVGTDDEVRLVGVGQCRLVEPFHGPQAAVDAARDRRDVLGREAFVDLAMAGPGAFQ